MSPADRVVLDELDRVQAVLAAYVAGPELIARLGGSFDGRSETGITIAAPPVFASLEVWPGRIGRGAGSWPQCGPHV